MEYYANYHKHTHYSNIMVSDCVVKPEDYMKRAVELGHKEYFTTEHGYQGNLYETFTLCQQYGLRCIFSVEAYYVNNRHEKDRGNYHLMLIARNKNGRFSINKILSEANLTGYYYKPRIDLELLFSLSPNDVYVTTACLGSPLFKTNDWETKFFQPVYNHFGDSLFLEVQDHNDLDQIEYNKRILELSEKYKVRIIHANDSHYIKPEDAKYRKLYVNAKRQGKSESYSNEDNFILDYPDYDTIVHRYEIQGVLSHEQILTALNNTNIMAKCDEVLLDKEFKIPKITEDSNAALRKLISEAWAIEKNNIPVEQHAHYEEEIEYETSMVERCNMADYFVLNQKVVKDAKEKYGGQLTHTGRGSAVSFYINKLLGLTEVDRIWSPVKMYPTRFLSDTRILETKSLPDIDQNWSTTEPILKSTADLLGEDGVRQMISFKPLQDSSAFRLWCKAKGMNIKEYDEVAKDIDKYSNDTKWSTLIEESKVFKGVIDSIAPSPCSYLLYDKPISSELGILKIKDVYCCILDGYNCDCYKFLKQDYLIVTVWDIINRVYDKIKQPVDDIKTLIKKCDDKVWKIFKDGMTTTINQCDSDYDKQILRQYAPHSFEELSAYVAAIRPGFASNLKNFIERKPYTTNVPELDELLKDSFHYLMYQESIMSYLVWLGIPEKKTYDIIKKISKKKFKAEELESLKTELKKNWIAKLGNEDYFDATWQSVEDSSAYCFNASHSASVCLDGMYGAYLKSHYPLEYFETVLNIYTGDEERTSNLISEMPYFGLKLGIIKFRHSGANYIADKETNTIHKGLESIKFMNESIAKALYDMRDQHFDSFIDFLKVNPCNTRQTEILIRLDFFSEFGKSAKLLAIHDLFQKFFSRKDGGYVSKKSIKKTAIEPFSIERLNQLCTKETATAYQFDDLTPLIAEYTSTINDEDITPVEKIEAQLEYLGYIAATGREEDRRIGYVRAVYPCKRKADNKTWAYKVSVTFLGKGKDSDLTIYKVRYDKCKLQKGDIFYAESVSPKDYQGRRYWYLMDYKKI
mgnify:FL=1